MTTLTVRKTGILALALALTLSLSGVYFSNVAAQGAKSQLLQSFQELFERSEKEKKGLNIYVRGQAIGAVFVRLIGAEAIEVRNQTYGRIIIRLDSIDAVAIN
jgi:hypothetical protein